MASLWHHFFGPHRWGPWAKNFDASTDYEFQHVRVMRRACLDCGTDQWRVDRTEYDEPWRLGRPYYGE